MLKLFVFTIYDSKAQAYMQPYCAPNEAVAIRDFAHAANSKDSQVGRFPEDFTLFAIGEWDVQAGTLKPYPTAKAVNKAINLIKEQN